jgi:hypothetical protein
MWFAVSQSYYRVDKYYPQVSMQVFKTQDACADAAEKIKRMANGHTVEAYCAPYSK